MATGQNGATSTPGDFTRMWVDFMSRMMSAGTSLAPEAMPPEMARSMRSAMFQAMSQYAEDFMRSPQFLEMMKQSADTTILFKKMLNDSLGQVQFEFQNASRADVDALVARLRRLEARLLERFDELSLRLERLEGRTAAGGGAGPASQAEPGPPSGGTKKSTGGGSSKRGGR